LNVLFIAVDDLNNRLGATARPRRIHAEYRRLAKRGDPFDSPIATDSVMSCGRVEPTRSGNLAINIYRHFRKQCVSCEFHPFEKWIDRYVGNRRHSDGVPHYLISASIENEP
jgi:hypothetical protein